MSGARLPMAVPEELAGLSTDIPEGLISAEFRAASERLDRFIGAVAVELAQDLDLGPGRHAGVQELLAARSWRAEGAVALRWLLETLELYGLASETDGVWTISAASGPSARDLRQEALAALPAVAPSYDVLDLARFGLPAVLRGEARGEDVLFSPSTLGLWFDYFSNANPLYAPNNELTAVAVARAVHGRPAVLEVGGGGGSAAQAALAALAAAGTPPSAYVFTELHPAFLRRGGRAINGHAPADCRVAVRRYDINLDPAAQDMAAERFDLIFGVNTVHLAADLVTALARLRSLLAPGGALVLGELVRPGPLAPVHLELPFALLEDYRNAPIDGVIRARPGFLSLEGWLAALRAAGFRDVTVLPAELVRCARIYPGFYCGAITAR